MSRASEFHAARTTSPTPPPTPPAQGWGDMLWGAAKAIPGVVGHSIANEVSQAWHHPGNEFQRLGGHVVNAASDIVGMVGNTTSAVGNSLLTEGQHRVADVGAGLTNFASSTLTGRSAGAQGSQNYHDVNIIPEAKMPKLDTTPGHKVFQPGSEKWRPAVGTPQSLGMVVPGHPDQTLNRVMNAAGTALLAVDGGGALLRAASKPLTAAIDSSAAGAVKGAVGAGVKAATPLVLTGAMLTGGLGAGARAGIEQGAKVTISAAAEAGASTAGRQAASTTVRQAAENVVPTITRAGSQVPDAASASSHAASRTAGAAAVSGVTQAPDVAPHQAIAPWDTNTKTIDEKKQVAPKNKPGEPVKPVEEPVKPVDEEPVKPIEPRPKIHPLDFNGGMDINGNQANILRTY